VLYKFGLLIFFCLLFCIQLYFLLLSKNTLRTIHFVVVSHFLGLVFEIGQRIKQLNQKRHTLDAGNTENNAIANKTEI